MDIKFTQSLGRDFLKNYSQAIQPQLRTLTKETAERLVREYEDLAPKDTGALSQSFYIVSKGYSGYAEALSRFSALRPKSVPSLSIPSTNSDYTTKVGAVASYLVYVNFWTPFIDNGLLSAQKYYASRLDQILKESGDEL